MITYITLFISYAIISFILRLSILGPLVKTVHEVDIKASVDPEDQLASPLFTLYSAAKICSLFYIMWLLNDSKLPYLFVGILGFCEIGLGCMNMMTSDAIKLPHLRNVNTSTTIGAILGYIAVVTYLIFNA
jgi:hypothetical protein